MSLFASAPWAKPRPSWQIVTGDNRLVLATLPDACIDAIVTDPPYGMSCPPDMFEVLRHWLAGDDYQHTGGGFMGKTWDSFVPGPTTWRHVLRVLKPGGHLLAFFAPRTYDLGVLAIRMAGFEIRDQLAYMFGTGFPKGKEIGRAIDMELCVLTGRHYDKTLPKGEKAKPGDHLCPEHPDGDPWRGHDVALKPAHEPIVLARKPLIGTVAANVLAHGTGGINVDACRVAADAQYLAAPGNSARAPMAVTSYAAADHGDEKAIRADPNAGGRWPANVLLDEYLDPVLRLRDNAPGPVRDFYADHEGVRGVRVPDDDPAEPKAAQAFLLSGLLRECAVDSNAGGAPDAGAQALTGIAGAHAGVGARAEGPGLPVVAGRQASEPRLRNCGDVDAAAGRAGVAGFDGEPQQQSMHPGAPAGDGAPPWTAALVGGIGASPQRDQARQPDREPGNDGQLDAQARAPGDHPRAESSAGGDRAIEIRASEVPAPWLKYFRRTGEAIRCGSAAALDEQSGTLATRGNKGASMSGPSHPDTRGAMAGNECGDRFNYDAGGGASRFFYTAKASKSEREAGLDHLPVRSGGDLTDRVDGSDGLNSPRAGAGRGGGRRNHHPTVKPIALMRYLVRLVTPPGGIVLDPFAGSGSTMVAAVQEGFNGLGLELDQEYANIARARVAHWEKTL